MKERITLTLDKDLLNNIDKSVDGHQIKNRSHAIELLLMRSLDVNRPKTAFILAGGRGTRLKPLTDEIPKPLIPVHDKPLLQHALDLFRKHGITEIIIALGFKGEKIKEYFGNGKKFGMTITYVEESKPLGTAGPLLLAKDLLTSTFVMCNADELKEIDLIDMYHHHKETKGMATIALTTVEDPSMYGVAKLQGTKIMEFIEKPSKESAPSPFINAGLYMLEPEVLNMVPEGFAMMETDVFPKIAKEGKLFGYPFSGQWFDVGNLERYEKALKEWKDLV
ncbi:NTP transferase domain-containing protein [Candidatus Woesearchaeota archaeon]|nr:NTP transferase domain-containing protein [Candidatus Woesearchaeota archaeon]